MNSVSWPLQVSNNMNFNWKLGETQCKDWTWDEIQKCNPKATSWDWERLRKGKLYPLPDQCMKVLILGSPKVGKSTLLWSYFDECDGPTVSVTACYGNSELHLHNMEDENGDDIRAYFCDTSRAENFHQLKEDVYRDTSVAIYCYAIDDFKSMNDLLSSWIPLSRRFLGNVPSILVGNMVDLRGNELNEARLITTEAGEYVKEVCGIDRFYECSIEDGETPQDVFQTALRLALDIEI